MARPPSRRGKRYDYSQSVPTDAIAEYQDAGHVTLRGLLPTERVEAVRPVVHDLVAQATRSTLPLEERDTYHKAFLQVGDLNRSHPFVREFAWDAALAKAAAALMGVASVRFYFDQALLKEPGGGATPWHQDHVYWPLDTKNAVSAWIPLVDVSPEMGAMEFVRGSHRGPYRYLVKISDQSDDLYTRLVTGEGLTVEGTGPMAVGDVSFHASWELHRALPNTTSRLREVLTVMYFEDGARLYKKVEGSQRVGYDVYFSHQLPGDLAGGELMPRLC